MSFLRRRLADHAPPVERKRIPRDKMHSGLTFKSDSGKIYILMGQIYWNGIGPEYTFASEDGEITNLIGTVFEDQVICA